MRKVLNKKLDEQEFIHFGVISWATEFNIIIRIFQCGVNSLLG